MNTDFTIRIAQLSDASKLRDLFQNTVLTINKRDYSKAEVEDWASCGNDLSHIKEMIRTHYFIVAINRQSQIVGFSSITKQGYLHSMFVHKEGNAHLCTIIYGLYRRVRALYRTYSTDMNTKIRKMAV